MQTLEDESLSQLFKECSLDGRAGLRRRRSRHAPQSQRILRHKLYTKFYFPLYHQWNQKADLISRFPFLFFIPSTGNSLRKHIFPLSIHLQIRRFRLFTRVFFLSLPLPCFLYSRRLLRVVFLSLPTQQRESFRTVYSHITPTGHIRLVYSRTKRRRLSRIVNH